MAGVAPGRWRLSQVKPVSVSGSSKHDTLFSTNRNLHQGLGFESKV